MNDLQRDNKGKVTQLFENKNKSGLTRELIEALFLPDCHIMIVQMSLLAQHARNLQCRMSE